MVAGASGRVSISSRWLVCVLFLGTLFLTTSYVYGLERSSAVDAHTRRVFGGLVRGGPVFSPSGSWYLSAEDRYLYRLEPGSLGTVHRVPLPGRPTDALTVAPWGTVYVGLENGGVIAISESGRVVFRIRPEYHRALPFAIGADGELVLSYPESRVLRAYAPSGVLLWSIVLSDVPVLPAVITSHGDIVVVTADRLLQRISPGGARHRPVELDALPTVLLAPMGLPASLGSTNSRPDVLAVVGDRLVLVDRDGQANTILRLEWSDLLELQQLDANSFLGLRRGGQAVYISWQQQLTLAENAAWMSSVAGAPLLGLRNGGLSLFSPVHGIRTRAPIEEAGGFIGGTQAHGHVLMAAENWGVYGVRVGVEGFRSSQRGGAQGADAGWTAPRGNYAAQGRPHGVVFRREGPAEWRAIPDFLYLEDILRGESSAGRRELLKELERRYQPGRAGSDIAYLRHLLESLGGEAYFSPIRRDSMIRNDFPWARAEAVRIMGKRPDTRTRNFLLRLGAVERNREVRVAILEQLLQLGHDPELGGAHLALRYLKEEAGPRPYEPLATAALSALRSLRSIEGEKLDPLLREAYRVVSEQNFSRELREDSLRRAREIE